MSDYAITPQKVITTDGVVSLPESITYDNSSSPTSAGFGYATSISGYSSAPLFFSKAQYDALTINQPVVWFTLENGSYATIEHHHTAYNDGYIIRFYLSDDTQIKMHSTGFNENFIGFQFVSFDYYYAFGFAELRNESDFRVFSNVYSQETYEAFYNGALPPDYVWTAWDQIAGNGGRYRCNLTMIKDASIGDFTEILEGTADDMSRISGQSDVMNIFHNIAYNQEEIIAWSGSNWLTLTLREHSLDPTLVVFTFKFYIPSVSETNPIYAYAVALHKTSWQLTDFYLSFVHDDEQQAALFCPVGHAPNGTYSWGYVSHETAEEMLYIWLWLQSSGSPSGDSPYSTGTPDNGGDPGSPMPQSHIDVPAPPSLGGLSTKLVTVYCPTEAQMLKISSFLWSADTIDNILKYFTNFSDNIMSFYVLPCKPTNLQTKRFKVGNCLSDDTDLQSVEYLSDRFIQIDMGDLVVEPYWDSYLDYSPYSKMEIYLPGVGVQQLDVDDIMSPSLQDGSLSAGTGSHLHLDYTIDLMTGILVAFLSVNGEMRYQFPGKIGYEIPLTGDNYTRLVQSYVTATAGLIGTIATGGAAAPFAAGATAAGIINAMKPDIYRGGNLSGDASMLSRKTPMLIYHKPNKPKLENQEEFTGFPSYKIGLLSEFSGYTEVLDAHVEGISCTEEEREKILAALKGGVII